MATQRNLSIDRGQSYRMTIRAKARGKPLPLTGWTGLCQFRPSPDSDEVFDELSSANGRLIITPEGHIALIWPRSITQNYEFSMGCYDVLMLSPNGDAWYVAAGSVSIRARTTKWPTT